MRGAKGKSKMTTDGPVRPGDRRPYKKPSIAEQVRRIDDLVAFMEARPGAQEGEYKRYFAEKWNVHWMTAQNYLIRARRTIRQRANRDPGQMRDIVVAYCLSCLADGDPAHRRAGLRAAEQLCKIFGLESARKVELTGQDGGPIQTEDVAAIRQASTEALRRIVAAAELGEVKTGRN